MQADAAGVDVTVEMNPILIKPAADVSARFVDRIEDLYSANLLILPGTKTTMADLEFLRRRGLATRILELARAGKPVLGICGGHQMLGSKIYAPLRAESHETEVVAWACCRW